MNHRISFVTTSERKYENLKARLEPFKINVFQISLPLLEPQSDDIAEISKNKAAQAYKVLQEPCIVSDAGFFINALNGFPGPLTDPVVQKIGSEGLLKLMRGIKNRTCEFRNSYAYNNGKIEKVFSYVSKGRVTILKIGDKGYPPLYNIFVPQGHEITLAEMKSLDTYDAHRKKVTGHFIEELAELIKSGK